MNKVMQWRRIGLYLLAVAMLLPVVPPQGSASAMTSGPTVVAPTDDAFVRAGSYSDSNYGSSTQLNIKSSVPDLTRQAYIKFDLDGYSEPIGSAKLYIYGHLVGETTESLQVKGLEDNDWSESTITWNNKPADGSLLQEIPIDPVWKWHEIDVTGYVKDKLTSGDNAGFALVQPGTDGTSLDFYSKESPYNKPHLILNPPPEAFSPTDDAFVRAGQFADQNFGSDTQLLVKNNEPDISRESFLKFDISSYTGEIGSAKLRVYGHLVGQTTEDMRVYGLEDDNWSEGTVTWNTRPDAAHALAAIQVDPVWKWHEVDITRYIKEQAANDGIVSLALIQPGDNGTTLDFNSKEHSNFRPVLELSAARPSLLAPQWGASAAIDVLDVDETALTLQWPAALYPDGVARYRIYENGKLLQEVEAGIGLSYRVTNLKSGKPYTFRIEAAGPSGTWSTDGPFTTMLMAGTEILQTQIGNIFLSNEPVHLIVSTPRSTVTWQVYDFWDNQVGQGSSTVTNGQADITITPPGLGYYSFKAQVEMAGRTPVSLATSFAVLDPFDLGQVGDESPFGVVTHLHRSRDGWGSHMIPLITRLGTKFIRDGLEWHSVEQQKGVYSFSEDYKATMNSVKDADLNMLFVTGFNNQFYDNNATPYTDEGREGFANYVKAYIEQFPDLVRWVEAYNEFNIGFGDRGDGPADSRPDYYYPLLKKVYETVKGLDPTITVMGPTPSEVNLAWLEELFQLGGLDYMEKFSIHPYRFPDSPELTNQQMYGLHNLIRQYNNGETKPIWTTEASWPTHIGPKGVTEEKQAQYLVRLMALSLANGVEKFWWYNLMDKGMDETYHEHRFGLVRNINDPLGAFTPKPAYAAYGTMTRMLDGYTYADTDTVTGTIYSIRFNNGQDDRRVLWSTGSENVTLHANQPVTVTDIMGNTETFTPYLGKVFLAASESPLYVDGAIDVIEAGSVFTAEAAPAFSGEPVTVVLKHDNTANPTAVSTSFELLGQSYPIVAEAGQTAETSISLPFDPTPVTRLIDSYVRIDGQLSGRLSVPVQIKHPLELKVQHDWADEDHLLRIALTNISESDVTLESIQLTTDAAVESLPVNSLLSGGNDYEVVIPLANPQALPELALDVKVQADQLPDIAYGGKAMMVEGGSITAIPSVSPVIDGDLTDWDAVDPILLPEDGTIRNTSYSGAQDLSGAFKVGWDDDNLYVAARFTDDVQHQPENENTTWKGDSIQFGISRGVPGENHAIYEYCLSLPSSGVQTYRWYDPTGMLPAVITDVELEIVRDENTKTTTYEFALPWSHLPDIKPDNGLYGFSLLVNDNDGGGRKGWLEWGAGIGATKDAFLYQTVRFVD